MSAPDKDMADLTQRLRALRLPDEEMLLISVGNIRGQGCGETGAIRVVASKAGITETVDALHLEDALLMVRARINDRIEARRKAAGDAKRKKAQA